jgi:hypothetical protein
MFKNAVLFRDKVVRDVVFRPKCSLEGRSESKYKYVDRLKKLGIGALSGDTASRRRLYRVIVAGSRMKWDASDRGGESISMRLFPLMITPP